MRFELIPYKGSMLTKAEIRLLQYSESLDDKRRKYEEEKRHERLILEQSLQTSALSGIQLVSHLYRSFKYSLLTCLFNEHFLRLFF